MIYGRTPIQLCPSNTVLAPYKSKDGQAGYTIKVAGQVVQASAIASGEAHTCAMLGTGNTSNKSTPVEVKIAQ